MAKNKQNSKKRKLAIELLSMLKETANFFISMIIGVLNVIGITLE